MGIVTGMGAGHIQSAGGKLCFDSDHMVKGINPLF